MPMTIGVYGIGWAAGAHLDAMQNHPGLRIAALGSRNRNSAEAKKKERNLTDCRVVDTFEEMLSIDSLEAIDICTPNALHAEEVIAACEAGKHLIIEKPVAMDLRELKSVREAVRSSGVITQTCFESRWNPYIQCLKSMIGKGGLGDLFYIQCDYYHEIGPWWHGYTWGANTKKGGPSATLVASCHAVDLMRFFGGEISRIKAMGCIGHRQDYEYEPTYAAVVRYADGTIGKTGTSFEIESPYVNNIVLHGDGGSVYNDRYYTERFHAGQKDWQTLHTVFLDSGDVSHHPYRGMMDDFVDAVAQDRAPLNNIDSSYRTHEACLAIDLSIETGEEIALPL